jgi:hypothetical protein
LEKFDERDEWTNHEQLHDHHEAWRCDELGHNGETCNKKFSALSLYMTHIRKDHEITSSEYDTDRRRIGPCFDIWIWCDFCKDIIKLSDRGLDVLKKRWDHIEDHVKDSRTYMRPNQGMPESVSHATTSLLPASCDSRQSQEEKNHGMPTGDNEEIKRYLDFGSEV